MDVKTFELSRRYVRKFVYLTIWLFECLDNTALFKRPNSLSDYLYMVCLAIGTFYQSAETLFQGSNVLSLTFGQFV